MGRVNLSNNLIVGVLVFYSASMAGACHCSKPVGMIGPRTMRIKPRRPSFTNPIKNKPSEDSQLETSTEANEIDNLNSLLEAVTGESFSSTVSNSSLELPLNETDQVVEVRTQRAKRLSPILGMVAPAISEFMGSLIRPLISSISNRAGNSRYKNELLTKLTHHVLANTPLANSNLEKAVENQLNQNKFTVAMQTLRSKEGPLSHDNYLPESWLDHMPNSKTMSPELYEAARIMFVQLTTTIDNLLKKRIRSATQLSTSFSSTIIENLRLKIQGDHKSQNKSWGGDGNDMPGALGF